VYFDNKRSIARAIPLLTASLFQCIHSNIYCWCQFA